MAWDQHSSMTVTQLLWTVNQKKFDNDNFDWHSHRYQNQYLYYTWSTLAVLLSNSMLQNSHFYVKYMFNIFFIMTSDIFSSQYLFTWQSLQVRSGVWLREAAGGEAPGVGGHQQFENIEAECELHPVPGLQSVHGWVVTVSLVSCHHNWYDLFRAWCRALDGASRSLTCHIISGLRTRARNEGLQRFYNHTEGPA